MLTAIVVLVSIDLFFQFARFGGDANRMKMLTQIEMNTRGYGK